MVFPPRASESLRMHKRARSGSLSSMRNLFLARIRLHAGRANNKLLEFTSKSGWFADQVANLKEFSRKIDGRTMRDHSHEWNISPRSSVDRILGNPTYRGGIVVVVPSLKKIILSTAVRARGVLTSGSLTFFFLRFVALLLCGSRFVWCASLFREKLGYHDALGNF